MHNMIIDNEEYKLNLNQDYLLELTSVHVEQYQLLQPLSFHQFAHQIIDVQREDAHFQLCNKLIKHL
jgi:hypothetical protein